VEECGVDYFWEGDKIKKIVLEIIGHWRFADVED